MIYLDPHLFGCILYQLDIYSYLRSFWKDVWKNLMWLENYVGKLNWLNNFLRILHKVCNWFMCFGSIKDSPSTWGWTNTFFLFNCSFRYAQFLNLRKKNQNQKENYIFYNGNFSVKIFYLHLKALKHIQQAQMHLGTVSQSIQLNTIS